MGQKALQKLKNVSEQLEIKDEKIQDLDTENRQLKEENQKLHEMISQLKLQNSNQKEIYEAKMAILEQNIKEYSDVTQELMSLHQKKERISEKKSEGLKAGNIKTYRDQEGESKKRENKKEFPNLLTQHEGNFKEFVPSSHRRMRYSQTTSMINRPTSTRVKSSNDYLNQEEELKIQN